MASSQTYPYDSWQAEDFQRPPHLAEDLCPRLWVEFEDAKLDRETSSIEDIASFRSVADRSAQVWVFGTVLLVGLLFIGSDLGAMSRRSLSLRIVTLALDGIRCSDEPRLLEGEEEQNQE